MKDKSVEANKDLDFTGNYKEKKILINYSNITGLSSEKLFKKKEVEKNKNNIISPNINFSVIKNNSIKNNLYQSLSKKEKIKYIHRIIKNCNHKDSFDFLAVKRKTYSLGYLIRQFDVGEKSKSFEENNICKIPYPLLYCISNRKLENNSSNLLAKILISENKNLSKQQENEIKNSIYSKLFNTDLSKLIKYRVRTNSILTKTNKNIIENNSKLYEDNKFPFLNKYIKSKVENYNYRFYNRNERISNTTGFFSKEKYKKLNLKQNIKRWNSTYTQKYNGKDKIKKKRIKNNVQEFKNRTVCLNNHKNNVINNSIINEKNNKIIEEIYYRKRKNQSQQRLIEIIKDVSHLKYNNQIIAFVNK